jgi:hypothetical protein
LPKTNAQKYALRPRRFCCWANDLLAARSQMLEDRWIKQALEEQEANVERTLLNRLRRRVQAMDQSEGKH